MADEYVEQLHPVKQKQPSDSGSAESNNKVDPKNWHPYINGDKGAPPGVNTGERNSGTGGQNQGQPSSDTNSQPSKDGLPGPKTGPQSADQNTGEPSRPIASDTTAQSNMTPKGAAVNETTQRAGEQVSALAKDKGNDDRRLQEQSERNSTAANSPSARAAGNEAVPSKSVAAPNQAGAEGLNRGSVNSDHLVVTPLAEFNKQAAKTTTVDSMQRVPDDKLAGKVVYDASKPGMNQAEKSSGPNLESAQRNTEEAKSRQAGGAPGGDGRISSEQGIASNSGDKFAKASSNDAASKNDAAHAINKEAEAGKFGGTGKSDATVHGAEGSGKPASAQDGKFDSSAHSADASGKNIAAQSGKVVDGSSALQTGKLGEIGGGVTGKGIDSGSGIQTGKINDSTLGINSGKINEAGLAGSHGTAGGGGGIGGVGIDLGGKISGLTSGLGDLKPISASDIKDAIVKAHVDVADKIGEVIGNKLGDSAGLIGLAVTKAVDSTNKVIGAGSKVVDGIVSNSGDAHSTTVKENAIKLQSLLDKITPMLSTPQGDKLVAALNDTIGTRNNNKAGESADLTPKQKDFIDAARKLDGSALKVLLGIIQGEKPKFSEMNPAMQTRLMDVLKILLPLKQEQKNEVKIEQKIDFKFEHTKSEQKLDSRNEQTKTLPSSKESPIQPFDKTVPVQRGSERTPAVMKPGSAEQTVLNRKVDSEKLNSPAQTKLLSETATNILRDSKSEIGRGINTNPLTDKVAGKSINKDLNITLKVPTEIRNALNSLKAQSPASFQVERSRPAQSIGILESSQVQNAKSLSPVNKAEPMGTVVLKNKDSERTQALPLEVQVFPPVERAEKKDSSDASPEQTIREKRNRDRAKRRTKLRCIVKEGDTLKSISQRYFGEEKFAPVIYHINKQHILCMEFNGKKYAVLKVDTIITIPDDEDVLAFSASEAGYAGIEFGGIQQAYMDATKDKILAEQDRDASELEAGEPPASNVTGTHVSAANMGWSCARVLRPFVEMAARISEAEVEEVFTGTVPADETSEAPRFQHQRHVSERIASGIRIVESECFSNEEQGVRISLRVQHQSNWVTICYYEVYATGSRRRQFFKTGKHVDKYFSLPATQVKSMSAQDFRKNFKAIVDLFYGA